MDINPFLVTLLVVIVVIGYINLVVMPDSSFSPIEPVSEGDCPRCSRYVVLTINGVNSDTDSSFHRWVRENVPENVTTIPIDPYDGKDEWCRSDPKAEAEEIQETIDELKEIDPCLKIIVVGHSLGATSAWFLNGADCRIFIDPPTDCYPFGKLFCPSQKSICESVNGPGGEGNGIENDPGFIPLNDHNPFVDPLRNIGDLEKIKDKLDDCFQVCVS